MIGIFDSGYGGLTIMKTLVEGLPDYDYLYLGDNARSPYGNRSKETIVKYTDQAIRYLLREGCRLVIIACFTASALALREMQEKYLRNHQSPFKNRKILGVLLPVVEKALSFGPRNRIGVVGTRAVIASKSFEIELKKINPLTTIFHQACPLLVAFIEEHWHEKPEAKMILKKYLRPLKSKNPQVLILGCTHYSHMLKDFQRIIGKHVKIVNPPEIVKDSLMNYLERHSEIETQLSKGGGRKFVTTDDPEKFAQFGKNFSGMEIGNVTRITLG